MSSLFILSLSVSLPSSSSEPLAVVLRMPNGLGSLLGSPGGCGLGGLMVMIVEGNGNGECGDGDGDAECGVGVVVIVDGGGVLLSAEGMLVFGLRGNWYFVLTWGCWCGGDHGSNMAVVSSRVRSSLDWSVRA